MDLGTAHVVAASIALALGLTLLARRKGDSWHIRIGWLYLATMLTVTVPVLFVYDSTGRPGPFHVLAIVSILITALGWSSVRRRGHFRSGVMAHATFMAWSWIGVLTAGVAQLANYEWPRESPWPVLLVVGVATLSGAVAVPRFVSRALVVPQRTGP